MSDLSESDQLARVMTHFATKKIPAESLFLPLVPRQKFPPPDRVTFPPEILVGLVTEIAFQAIFPFLCNRQSEALGSKQAFHDFINGMAADRTEVIKCPLTITIEDGINATLRLEFCFASRLLSRVRHLGETGLKGKPYFYHFLVDLVCQGIKNAADIRATNDENGNYWLRLRGKECYRPGAFYSDVTIVVHNIRELVHVVFAESDDDVDEWYRYEWMSSSVKDTLFRCNQPIMTDGSRKAVALGGLFEKFAKLLTEKPG